jgi:hypothetical protein
VRRLLTGDIRAEEDIIVEEYAKTEKGPDMSAFEEEMRSYIQTSSNYENEDSGSAKPQGTGWLQDRLIQCNIKRRSKLHYGARHSEDTSPSQQRSVLSTPGTTITEKLKPIYPPPPKVDVSSNSFQCPFCRQLLPRHIAKKKYQWRYVFVVGLFYIS